MVTVSRLSLRSAAAVLRLKVNSDLSQPRNDTAERSQQESGPRRKYSRVFRFRFLSVGSFQSLHRNTAESAAPSLILLLREKIEDNIR